MRWRHVPKVLRMDLKWWKALGGDPYKWWVYFGTILPASIVEVRNTHTDHVLSPKETEEARQGARIKGVHYSTAIQWLRFEDALVTKTLIKEAA